MTDTEIFKTAVEKAMHHGWRYGYGVDGDYQTAGWTLYDILNEYSPTGDAWDNDYFKIIFSHEFAQAFFGQWQKPDLPKGIQINGSFVSVGDVRINGLTKWEYHLQQMALKKEPLKYLERHL
jgi:hypothetical protein